MSYIKRHLEDCMEYANTGNWAELLKALEPWGDDAPQQLWGVLEFLRDHQELIRQEKAAGKWNRPQVIPVEMNREIYETANLVNRFEELSRDGYTALSLGLIIDLIRQEKEI